MSHRNYFNDFIKDDDDDLKSIDEEQSFPTTTTTTQVDQSSSTTTTTTKGVDPLSSATTSSTCFDDISSAGIFDEDNLDINKEEESSTSNVPSWIHRQRFLDKTVFSFRCLNKPGERRHIWKASLIIVAFNGLIWIILWLSVSYFTVLPVLALLMLMFLPMYAFVGLLLLFEVLRRWINTEIITITPYQVTIRETPIPYGCGPRPRQYKLLDDEFFEEITVSTRNFVHKNKTVKYHEVSIRRTTRGYNKIISVPEGHLDVAQMVKEEIERVLSFANDGIDNDEEVKNERTCNRK